MYKLRSLRNLTLKIVGWKWEVLSVLSAHFGRQGVSYIAVRITEAASPIDIVATIKIYFAKQLTRGPFVIRLGLYYAS